MRYNYARFGYTRGGGKTWHGGIDLEALDDETIYMPTYKGKSISGTVTRGADCDRQKQCDVGVGILRLCQAGHKPDAGCRQLPVFLPLRQAAGQGWAESQERHDLTLRSIKREIAAGRDVAYWLDKAYTHLDSGLLTEDDITEVETLAQAYYDALDAEDSKTDEPTEDAETVS